VSPRRRSGLIAYDVLERADDMQTSAPTQTVVRVANLLMRARSEMSNACSLFEIDVDIEHNHVRVTALARDAAERRCFGGPPIAYHARSLSSSGEFRDATGNPYGGTVTLGLDGALLSSTLYRAGCFGQPAPEVAAMLAAAVAKTMTPHHETVLAALRVHLHGQVAAAVTHWAAEVERLRAELATGEQNLADATRALLLLDTTAEPCEHASHASPDPDSKS
jgi:hypothetical protein